MTPAARYAAAIEVLDDVLEGRVPEAALLAWMRSHRFAGSKDRAGIRDIVFSIDRRRASCSAMGQGNDGRSLVRGYLAQENIDEKRVFGAGGYAPTSLRNDEPPVLEWEALPEVLKADVQTWVWRLLQADHGSKAQDLAEALRHRAPVWVRANLAKAEPKTVIAGLEDRGFSPQQHHTCPTAIRINDNSRKIGQDAAYLDGQIEMQDLAPQAAVGQLGIKSGETVLDYCAGGGGKALAMAALGASVTAHDTEFGRMKDIPARAKRAGLTIQRLPGPATGQYDLVLCDVPCSGSGAWRRATANKWSLEPDDLSALVSLQREILTQALPLVRPGGRLAYMTCSLFAAENSEQASWLGKRTKPMHQQHWMPIDDADGFFLAVFRKN